MSRGPDWLEAAVAAAESDPNAVAYHSLGCRISGAHEECSGPGDCDCDCCCDASDLNMAIRALLRVATYRKETFHG